MDPIKPHMFLLLQNNYPLLTIIVTQKHLSFHDIAIMNYVLQKKTLLSVHSEEINYDDNEKLATIKNFTIRSFGVPFLYWPKFSFHTDGRGDSGLLMPKFVMNGLKQAGIEIPLYWKIRPDIDLIASRIQYIPMKTSWKETRNEKVNKYGNVKSR